MKIEKALSGKDICKIIMDNGLQKTLCNGGDWMEYLQKPGIETKEDCVKYMDDLGLRNFEEVDGKCNTDELYSVIHFKDQNVYVKITGEYDSYGNYEHYYNNNVVEVFPKLITKTIYE